MMTGVIPERIFILSTGAVLDLLLGDPHILWHPVKGMGSIISGMEKLLYKAMKLREGREEDKGKKLAAGAILLLVTLFFSVGIPLALLYAVQAIHPCLRTALECVMCYRLLAMKSLKTESRKVYQAFLAEGLTGARKAVSMIVGRDTENLEEEGVIRAAVETVAENTCDAVVAPLFYMMLLGTLGGFFYKAVNTMDSMIGYRNDRYLYFGRAAARLDDVMNFIPSRLAAAMMILASFLLGFDGKNAAFIYKRDRYCHKSPNSAQTESVLAGALSIRLGGDAWYFGKLCHKPFIGEEQRKIEWEDIKRADRLLYGTSFLTFAAGIGILAVISFFVR